MNKYSLDQIIHFDNCLFPDDLTEDFKKIGLFNDTEIDFYKNLFRILALEDKLTVKYLYQINDNRVKTTIETLLNEFVVKFYK
jgi:hypothetical protein